MKYKIIGVYQGKREIVDTATTIREALHLVMNYRMAFGRDWEIYLEEER